MKFGTQKATFKLENAPSPKDEQANDIVFSGDGTVPFDSGNLITEGGSKPITFRMTGFDHQMSSNEPVRECVLWSIAKIVQLAPPVQQSNVSPQEAHEDSENNTDPHIFVRNLCSWRAEYERIKTYCVGRYLVDVPANMELYAQMVNICSASSKTNTKYPNISAFQQRMKARENGLKKPQHKSDLAFDRVIDLHDNGMIFLKSAIMYREKFSALRHINGLMAERFSSTPMDSIPTNTPKLLRI